MRPTVILLSFNSADTLGATLARAREVSDEIFVIDSFSTDSTVALAESFGAKVVQHAFENYGAQRNWAIDNLPITGPGSSTSTPTKSWTMNSSPPSNRPPRRA